MRTNTEIFPDFGIEELYIHKNPIIRSLFLGRIKTALSFAEVKNESRILDLGSGGGYLLKSIRKDNTQCECWGTDVVESQIMSHINCHFILADAKNLPFEDNYFNIVFALDTLEHIKDDVDMAIKEIHRVLAPGGVAILSGPTESWFYKFCRLILFYTSRNSDKFEQPIIRRNIDFHYHTIYELEKGFIYSGFKVLKIKKLPKVPLPTLFKVSKLQK